MKNLFLPIIFALCSVAGISAQSPVLQSAPFKAKNALMPVATADTDPFVKLGYCNDYITNGVGVKNTEVSVAVFYPASKVTPYIGKKIYGVRFGLTAPVTGMSFFIRNTLTGENVYTEQIDNPVTGWNNIVLATPFEITGEFYLGYTSTSSDLQVGLTLGLADPNAVWLQIADEEWTDYSSQKFGTLCIEAILPADELPDTEMQVIGIVPAYAKTNNPYKILAVTRNNSFTAVNSYDISYQIAENAVKTGKITKNLNWYEQDTLEVDITDPLTARGIYNVSLTIDKVNDTDDVYTANNTGTGTVKAMDYIYPKKIVVEEGTGTWCGWCPRGMVGMELMKEKYDDFIGIAVHNGDGMVTSSYSKIATDFFSKMGYPACVVNRKLELLGDPYGDIEYMFLLERAIPTEIGVNLTAQYVDASQKTVKVKATSTFGFDLSDGNANYRLAYVLIEHGVTGTGTGYTQKNFYAGGGNGPMHGFESLPAEISGMEFNDVARNIYQYTGILNSIPASITGNEPVSHEYNISLPATIKNKDKLEVIVLLMNIKTGEIINAEITDISPATGLEDSELNGLNVYINNDFLYINSENVTVNDVAIYNTSGQLIISLSNTDSPVSVAGLRSGIYLIKVKTSEGDKIVKVIK